jgi:hypothetical protein
MKKTLGILLFVFSIGALVWTFIEDFKSKKKAFEDRNKILEKAREAKAVKAMQENEQAEKAENQI